MEKERIAQNAVEFRDAVMELHGDATPVCVRPSALVITFRVLPSMTPVKLDDLFKNPYPPVHMEDLASAMNRGDRSGELVPEMVVFTLDSPGATGGHE